jgi:hypothetical protein
LALLLTALNKVDFPTLGNPTIPACKAIISIVLRAQKYNSKPKNDYIRTINN